MAELDDIAVKNGLEIRQMMELAGWHMLSLFNAIKIDKKQRILVVVGKGNKGGDGLSSARHLLNHGYLVDIIMLEKEISVNAQHHLELLRASGFNIANFNNQDFSTYQVIIDSLIGYRLEGRPRGVYSEVIKKINYSSATAISYDIPTGLDSTTGLVQDVAIKADYTLMLALAKKVVMINSAHQYLGKVYLADIGISRFLYDQISMGSRPNFELNGLLKIASSQIAS